VERELHAEFAAVEGWGTMKLEIEFEQETEGRWIAEIPSLPGVMAYGSTRAAAESKVEAMALHMIMDRIEPDQSACPEY
jgi:predicted RNase H-like HicB family nuclease